MSGPEPIETIQQAIRKAVARASDELREEILTLLREQTSALERTVTEFSPSEPASFLTEEDIAPLVRVDESVDQMALLREAATAIDRAGDQREILQTLVSAGGHFAHRSALFLTRKDEVRGWAMHGFDVGAPAIAEIRLDYGAGSPWKRLLQAGGVIRLSAGECAPLASSLESTLPREAYLVPLIIGDRIAAALYADCLDDSRPIAVEALELLTYLAALAVETLPFRSRRSTPTLYQAGDIEMTEILSPWDPEEGLAVSEPEEEIAKTTPTAPAPSLADGDEVETTSVPSPVESAPPETTIETAPAAPVLAEEPEAEETEEAASDYGFAESPTAPAAEEDQSETSETLHVDLSEDETVLLDRPPLPPTSQEAPSTPPAPPPSAPSAPEALAEEPAPAAPDEEEEEETRPGHLAAHPASANPATAQPLETAEVEPPADVFGPGLAFSSGEGESAVHDEARRLARLLVSEIKLYNENEVLRGRELHDLYERLQSDIERSREIYEERIDPALRRKTEYFDQELVRILAAGDRSAMGGEFEQPGE